jgi:hypothetical protein
MALKVERASQIDRCSALGCRGTYADRTGLKVGEDARAKCVTVTPSEDAVGT